MLQSRKVSGYKESLPGTDVKTSRKNELGMMSPFRTNEKTNLSSLKFRSPLREQQIQDYNRIKSELKKQISIAKENVSLNKSGHWVSIQEYSALSEEFRYETQRLLYEIQKLHQAIRDIQIRKNIEIQKIKEENDKHNFMSLSQVRQGHTAQIDMLQTQLRKTKELLSDKTVEYQNTIKRQQREIKQLNNETSRLSNEVKLIIDQKNSQSQSAQKEYTLKLQILKKEHQQEIQQIKLNHQKELTKLNRMIEIKQSKIQQGKQTLSTVQIDNLNLQHQIQTSQFQKIQIQQLVEEQMRNRYQQLKESLLKQNESLIQEITQTFQLKQNLLSNQINKLKQYILLKNQDAKNLNDFQQERLDFLNNLKAELQTQNEQLKRRMSEIQQQNMQQLQILKVKVAALHQNDIQTLVKTYQLKIQTYISQIKEKQDTISRLTQNLYEQSNHRFQMRKKYSIQLSQLNQKLIKLRSGMANMQTDFKEKLQNQKTMLLLTSRNLIKDMESKTMNTKATEIQLHKLKLLYQQNQKQLKYSNQIIDQKVKIAQQQLHRLTSHVMEQKKRHMQTQNTYKQIVQNKNQQIQKLQAELSNITHPQFDNSKQMQLIDQLKSQIYQKKVQNAKLKDQTELLQKKISIMQAEIDQYRIENQITQEEAKKEFQRISQQNMDQFQKFYQSRIQVLQQEKNDLKLLISSKEEKITSLVQKYQQLQKTMKQTLAKIKKRTELQTKVIALGTDNNLVKNMAQIVRNNLEHKK